MSGVVVLAPIIMGAAWPAISAAATAVMVSMGYVAIQTAVGANVTADVSANVEKSVEIELANQEEVSQNIGRGEALVFTKDGITVKFSRDIRGRMKVCVTGSGHADSELEELGRDLAGRVIQQYTYSRLMNEMKNRTGLSVVDQSVDEDNTIRIKLRSWEDD